MTFCKKIKTIKFSTFIFGTVFLLFFLLFGFLLANKAEALCCSGYCCNGPSKTSGTGCACTPSSCTYCPCGADTNTQPWSKYKCSYVNYQCYTQQQTEYACSLGDKCISGEKGLRLSYCTCCSYVGGPQSYGSLYKWCCKGPGNSTPVNCANYYQQDNCDPPEGVCPSGSLTLTSSCPASCGPCQYQSGGNCYDYCSGTATSCGCTSCTNCNSSDGWYNVGSTYYCCDGSNRCTCQNQEYHDYYCSGTNCTYAVTMNQIVKSGCAYNSTCVACSNDCSSGQTRCSGSYVQNCTDCDADPCLDWCNYEYCSYGCSGGVCNSAPSGCYYDSGGCAVWYPGLYPYRFDVCGQYWCWPQCPYGECCCKPDNSPWCCWDSGAVSPTNCACGAPYCCWSTSPVLCHDVNGNGPYCYSAGTLCTGCNGNQIIASYVTTNNAASIEETSAQLSGNVTSVNNANPDQRILEWGITSGSYLWNHNSGSGGTGVFSYNPTDLVPGTTYYFRAKAHNAAGWGYGSQNSFTTKPEAPSNLSCSVQGKTQINLTWSKGLGAEKTLIRKKIGSYPSSPSDGTQVYFDTGNNYADTGLNCNTHYYYRAWSYKSGAPNSGYSDGTSDGNTTTDSCLNLPSVLTNDATSVGETTATLNGTITNDGGEACQYRFEYDTNSGIPYANNTGWSGAENTKTTGQSFTKDISSLNKGTKYYFRAQAKNSIGTGNGSEREFLTKPGAPTNFTAAPGNGQVILSWTKGEGADVTVIKSSTSGYPSDPSGGMEISGTNPSHPYTGLTNGIPYYYSAWSKTSGSTQYSDRVTASATPQAPAAVTADFSCSLDGTNWQSCAGISVDQGDTVYFKDDATVPNHSAPLGLISSREWQKRYNGSIEILSSDNEQSISTILSSNPTDIWLIVNGGEDAKVYTIGVIPMPEWHEVSPF